MMNKRDTPTAIADIRRIKNEVPIEELYNVLAEEATELAQAALKMNRVDNDDNPTPIDEKKAYENLIEEYTDVLNVADRILELKPNWMVGDFKLHRWCTRIDIAKAEAIANDDETFECEECRIVFDD